MQDHPYQARHLDTWTLLSVIAARTSRVRVAPNVANLPLRQPVVLARSVATLDLLTGGRVELGLGAGAFWDAIAAVGGPRLDRPRGIDALEEGIGVIRAIWDTGARSVRVDGRPPPGPGRASRAGAGARRRHLARRLQAAHARADRPARRRLAPEQPVRPAGRAARDEPRHRRGAAATPAATRPRSGGSTTSPGVRRRGTDSCGPAGMWAEQLAELALEHGMSGFIVMGDDPEVLRRFAGEVAPAVRELVDARAERGQDVRAGRGGRGRFRPRPSPITPTPDDGRG